MGASGLNGQVGAVDDARIGGVQAAGGLAGGGDRATGDGRGGAAGGQDGIGPRSASGHSGLVHGGGRSLTHDDDGGVEAVEAVGVVDAVLPVGGGVAGLGDPGVGDRQTAPAHDEEDGLIGGGGLESAPVDGGGDAVDEEGA